MMTPTKVSAFEILKTATTTVWNKMGKNKSNPPEITLEKLQQWMPEISNNDITKLLTPPEKGIDLEILLNQSPKEQEPDNWQMKTSYRIRRCNIQHTIDEKPRTQGEINSLEDGIVAIHKLWNTVNKTHKGEFYHPIEPIIEAYLEELTANYISAEYDRTHPASILKSPLGTIKDVNLIDIDKNTAARLREFAKVQSIKQVEQLPLFDMPQLHETVLPDPMYLEIASPFGIKPKNKKGAVSHTLRIFFEALMALEPNQTNEVISFSLGDLIKYLYPNQKFHRTNQLTYITNALNTLHFYATVPYEVSPGRLGKWRPVIVRNPIEQNSKNEDLIFLDVRLPPDAEQGMLVEKQKLRCLGQTSAPKFSAYLSACYIFDKYGTLNGKIIDPTIPIINRNTEGYLTDTNGNELINHNGNRMKKAYNSNAISQLLREPNPHRTQYPTLHNADLIKACNLQNLSQHGVALIRAKNYWKELENEGIVKIEIDKNGWRIMPSEEHIETYRAVVKSIKAFH
ncbi:MAG: hypothetical protein OXU23_05085 [Candidatus Poribacteria bacterium]|nr:hypothetical protein [Candidatus Poribacteria bacterium]